MSSRTAKQNTNNSHSHTLVSLEWTHLQVGNYEEKKDTERGEGDKNKSSLLSGLRRPRLTHLRTQAREFRLAGRVILRRPRSPRARPLRPPLEHDPPEPQDPRGLQRVSCARARALPRPLAGAESAGSSALRHQGNQSHLHHFTAALCQLIQGRLMSLLKNKRSNSAGGDAK